MHSFGRIFLSSVGLSQYRGLRLFYAYIFFFNIIITTAAATFILPCIRPYYYSLQSGRMLFAINCLRVRAYIICYILPYSICNSIYVHGSFNFMRALNVIRYRRRRNMVRKRDGERKGVGGRQKRVHFAMVKSEQKRR